LEFKTGVALVEAVQTDSMAPHTGQPDLSSVATFNGLKHFNGRSDQRFKRF
jgi:hypothetical protein